MLLTEEIDVGLIPKNIPYYENLGYNIPRSMGTKNKIVVRRGTRIKVKTTDLPKYSNFQVEVSCDNCGKVNMTYYCNYNRSRDLYNGKYYCHHCVRKLFYSGENHHNWNEDITPEERLLQRRYPEYLIFVKACLARDNYTCQCCGQKHGDLKVHHLDGYNWCKEKRTDVTNGITLCETCHGNFHMQYGLGNNTKEQFEEWLGKSITNLEKYNGDLPTTRKVYCFEDDLIIDNVRKYCKKGESQIYSCCNRKICNKGTDDEYRVLSYKGKHYFWLDEYESMSKEEVQEIVQSMIDCSPKEKVVCVTTGKVFDSMTDGATYYNRGKNGKNGISACCRKKQNYSGKLPDGTPLLWMYLSDYKKMSEEDVAKWREETMTNIKVNKNKNALHSCKKVICITTNELFDSVVKAKEYYHATKVGDCCNGKRKASGKLNNVHLQWMFYEDFLQLSREEQQIILSKSQKLLNKKGENNYEYLSRKYACGL
jgi:hypothetical protein|nr:MAG TPA: NinG protein [Caudoviricetes sp.]